MRCYPAMLILGFSEGNFLYRIPDKPKARYRDEPIVANFEDCMISMKTLRRSYGIMITAGGK